MSKRWFGLRQREEVTMTPREKRDMPYIVLAAVVAALMVALAALWR
ncbi:hypothetical protein I6F35_02445 [Bradyrhizobium sp. BRP22]|nr:hypothetical protein [Bradyrhizobium sp. BRP22]MCA1452074.1 hypothetical protein [Bradyrhizobium sp. BRP22]